MNLASHLFQWTLRLQPPLTRDLIVERDLRVPMRDGVDHAEHESARMPGRA